MGWDWNISRKPPQHRLILETSHLNAPVAKRYPKITPHPIRAQIGSTDQINEFDDAHHFIHLGHHDSFEIDPRPDDSKEYTETLEFQQKSIDIDRRIQSDLSNASLWLELVAHQDSMHTSTSKQSTHHFINEKQLVIVEKALVHTQDDALLVAYMTLFSEFSPFESIMAKWRTILNKCHSFPIWLSYIDFRQTCASFTISDMVEIYEDALHALNGQGLERESEKIHVFKRACGMIGQAGYTERATGLFQALIEFNLFAPLHVSSLTFEEKISAYEVFWDSDAPRFGDEGALGWKDSSNEPFLGQETEKDGQFDDIEDEMTRWSLNELHSCFTDLRPQRGCADVEDPYRTVLFDDIRSLLFEIKSNKAKRDVVQGFLELLGISAQMGSSSSHAFKDSFMNDFFTSSTSTQLFLTPQLDSVELCFPLHRFPQTLWNMIGSEWPEMHTEQKLYCISQSGSDQVNMVESILSQSRLILTDHTSSQLLALHNAADPKIAEKKAKYYLKAEPANLVLWCSYAHILIMNKKHKQAQQVYQTALKMLPTLPASSKNDSIYLYSMYAELEHSLESSETAIDILLSCSEESYTICKATPTTILKAIHWYVDRLKGQLLKLEVNQYCIEMEKYLMLLNNYSTLIELTQNLDAAVIIYQDIIKSVQKRASNSVLEEIIHQQLARKVYHFAITSRSFKPSLLRLILEDALKLFPLNTLLISLYAWNEARTKIENRTRRFISEHCGR